MKSIIRIALILALCLALCVTLVACGNGGDSTDTGDDSGKPEIPSITVVFSVDGNEYARLSTNGDSPITLPTDPIKDGYTFKGWFFEGEEITSKFFMGDVQSSSTVIVNAEFEANVHVHTYATLSGCAPTCTDTGLTDGVVCTSCNEVITEQTVIAAKGHTETKIEGYAASCTLAGLTDGLKCSVCDAILISQETIAPKGHVEELVAGYAASCTEDGITDAKVCTVCHETTLDHYLIYATGHKTEKIAGYAATCTEDGLTDGEKCTVCQTILVAQRVITAKGHKTTTVYAKNATCTEDGLTSGEKCTVCNVFTVEQTIIPAKGHSEITIFGSDASCTKDGLTNGKRCKTCGTTTIAQEVIPASGHKPTTVVGTPATCTKGGISNGSRCSVCKIILVPQTQIPATGHTSVSVSGYAKTCTEDGLTDGEKCSVCEVVLTPQTVIKASGHKNVKGCCTVCSFRTASEGLSFKPEGDGYYVTGLGTCKDTEIIIPETYEGKSVIGIADEAFFDSKNYSSPITYVDVPESINYIGNSAFLYCKKLTEVKLPSTVTYLGESAFSNCEALENIKLPTNITAIPDYFFSGCKLLSAVDLPSGITKIGKYAFSGCKLLSSINLTDSLTEIGTYAFNNCEKITGADLSNVSVIPTYAFHGCKELAYLKFSTKLTAVLDMAFYSCESISSLELPISLTEIGGGAFAGCSKLSGALTIPEEVTVLGVRAFLNCSLIEEIYFNAAAVSNCGGYVFQGAGAGTSGMKLIIGKKVTFVPEKLFAVERSDDIIPNIVSIEFEKDGACTEIKATAFYGCNKLKTVNIPSTVTAIGNSAFAGCKGLTYLYYNSTAPMYNSDFSRPVSENAFANIGKDSEEFVLEIGKDTLCIPSQIFRETGITDLVFEENSSCTEIGSLSFGYCYNLKRVVFGESITKVGESAFNGCEAITEVHARDLDSFCGISYASVDDDGEYNNANASNPLYYAKTLYYNGEPVTNLVISEGVTKIGCGALLGCTSITSVSIPASVVEIGNFAFSGCTNLKSASFAVTTGWSGYGNAEETSAKTSIRLPTKVGNTTVPNYRVLNELHVTYYWKRF